VRRLDPIREDGKSESFTVTALAGIFRGDDCNDDFRQSAQSRIESGRRRAKKRRGDWLTIDVAVGNY
jgi:hypothetical protein